MQFDLILKGGTIIDGTGAPPFKADLGIKDGVISKIGDLSREKGEIVLDVKGLIVAPGFIDIHNHSDLSIFLNPLADNYVMQGVTTIVTGNCGASPAPLTDLNKDLVHEAWRPISDEVQLTWSSFEEYLLQLEEIPKTLNIATLVGHGTIRMAILGADNVKPSSSQLIEMQELVEEAMRAGAFGLSSGLAYIPGAFADEKELVSLLRVVARYGGIYATHMRDQGDGLLDSLYETLITGTKAGVGIQVSHIKAAGRPNWGKMRTALGIISDYAARGYDVSADVYPYTAASTSLASLLPAWMREGGIRAMLRRLSARELVNKARRELEERMRVHWEDIRISRSLVHAELEGKSLEAIGKLWSCDPYEALIKLLKEDEGVTGMIVFAMLEEDVKEAIRHPLVAIGSDGSIRKPGKGKPHPRNYGTFPRVIARYVREEKVLGLPEAIRKMTSLPARKLGLWDRGIVRPGMRADLVVFNYYTIADTATYENPHSYPKGIVHVIVNGELVVHFGRMTKNRPGRLLRRKG